jgi:hypothetical protein
MHNYEQYKTDDGEYISPKNNKTYKSLKALIAHLHNNPVGAGWSNSNKIKCSCEFCSKQVTIPNLSKHEKACWLNPTNIRKCNVCYKPIKDYLGSKGTCSRSCANVFFKSGENNGNFKGDSYQYICFKYHLKKCIVCGEEKIVAVHHYNEDHFDDRPENLIPLCPTHHQYMHSRYKEEILPMVEEYVRQFTLRFA